jgi:hypothetical protein
VRKGEVVKRNLIDKLREKGIFVIELNDIVNDLVEYVTSPNSKDYLRKDFVLELLHLLQVCGILKA